MFQTILSPGAGFGFLLIVSVFFFFFGLLAIEVVNVLLERNARE